MAAARRSIRPTSPPHPPWPGRKLLCSLLLALGAGACQGGRSEPAHVVVPGGDPQRGVQVIQAFGCGACHMIPGIDAANGLVGPPLIHWARRSFIAGSLPNSPENLVEWVTNPDKVEPGTAMPNLGVTEQQARDVAAYLYRLR